ncbi:MAG: hypothetical protein WBB19_04485 [Desulforhopalus sp.]
MVRWLLCFLCVVVTGLMPEVGGGYTDIGEDRNINSEPVLAVLEINATENVVAAYKSNAQPRLIELRVGETVRGVKNLGVVGTAVTSERMLAISADSFQWHSLPLEFGEESANSYISQNLGLFVTMNRCVIFDADLDGFYVYDIPFGQTPVAQEVVPKLAVIVTMEQAIGYDAGSGVFQVSEFQIGETSREIEASVNMISVVTSERTLLFQGTTGRWMERIRQ